MNDTRCPTCASPVRVVSADEGTSHYEPVGTPGLNVLTGTEVSYFAARTETPGLDVERLARALRNMSGYLADPLDAGDYAGLLSVSDFAADIAREYAALEGEQP